MARITHADVLIVGAGIAGLMAANALASQGWRVIVVEKSSRVGGRLATETIGPGRADSGAQFFTARTDVFRETIARWMEDGLVFQWSSGWSDGSLGATPPTGQPRYAVRGGMHALGEHLARGRDVRLDTWIVSAMPDASGWSVCAQDGIEYAADALLLTPPVPLALDLLDSGDTQLASGDRAALEQIEYAPCLAGIFWVNGTVNLPEPGAVQRPNATLTWIADNRSKGISDDATLITVHTGPGYSHQLWSLPDQDVLNALASGLNLYKEMKAEIIEGRLTRWRYAMPVTGHPARHLRADGLPPLVFAGDAFGGPRVEGAALSGLSAAVALAG
jgi:renalase